MAQPNPSVPVDSDKYEYRYKMPCGQPFYSSTPSVADDHGYHWFPCTYCETDYHVLSQEEIDGTEEAPRKLDGQRYSEAELAQRVDQATIRARIRAHIEADRDASNQQIAGRVSAMGTRVTEKLVRDVRKAIRSTQYDPSRGWPSLAKLNALEKKRKGNREHPWRKTGQLRRKEPGCAPTE
jgi:hypothetical protein